MSKLLAKIEARPWVAHVDDERDSGSGYMIMLADGFDFACDPGCGVRGFDTLTEVERETRKKAVIRSDENE